MIVSNKLQYCCYLKGNSWRGLEKYEWSALFQQVSTNGSNGRRRCKKATSTAEQTTKSVRFYCNSSSQDEQRNEKQLAFCA